MQSARKIVRTALETLEPRLLFSSLNILTRHGSYMNDGANSQETVLTPSNVNPSDFGKQFTNVVDGGDVIAAPLYMQNVNITAGSSPGVHSVVFVGTEADGLYALDANTGATLWHDNFTNITDPTNLNSTTGVSTILRSDIDNNPDVGTQLGILATPTIDPNAGVMYLITNTKEIRTDGKHFVQRLWAVSISNGVPVMSPAVIGDTIAPNGLSTTGPYTYVSGPIINGTGNNSPYNSSGGLIPPRYPDTDGWTAAPGGATGYVVAFNAIEQMERPALTLLNGSVYLSFASHGDDGPYYGWVLGYNTSNLALNAAFVTTPTFESDTVVGSSQPFWNLGGIWMSGSPIATDGTSLYVVTGNGAFNGNAANFNASGFPIDHDYGDSVLKLSVDSSTISSQNGNGWGLKVGDYFTPSNQLELNDLDLDLGSGGATLLPNNLLDSAGNPMLVVGGKESRVYLLDRNNLGKFNYNYPGGSSVDPSTYDHVLAEYANNGTNNDGKQIYSSAAYYNGNFYLGVNSSSAIELNVAAMLSGSFTATHSTYSFGYPAETFIVSSNGNTNGVLWVENPGGSDLLAFNASNFTNPIYDSNTNPGDSLGGSIHFHSPTEADGMVYAGSRGGGLSAYGLDLAYLNSNAAFFGAPTLLNASEVASSDIHLSWTNNAALATEVRIDRSVNDGAWLPLQYVSTGTTSYDDTTITSNARYQYRIVAISGANATASSNVATIALPLLLAGQSYYLRLDSNGSNLDIWTNPGPIGGTLQSLVLSQIPSIAFTASGTTSNLTIDFSNGDPLPASGLSFNGSGLSTLKIIGDAGNDSITVNASSISVTGSFGAVPITYAGATAIQFTGGTGSNTLVQTALPGGGANVGFYNLNSTDIINVSAGSMTIPMPTTGTTPVTSLNSLIIGAGAQVALSSPSGSASRALLELNTLNMAGASGSWTGRLDLAGNDLLLHAANLGTIDNQIAQAFNTGWIGAGTTSSAAAADTSHLTAIGAIPNNDGNNNPLYSAATPLGQFDGINPLLTDTLIRTTYLGDANLNRQIDAADYSRIDNGFLSAATGWINGDFNYDNTINGSDYTLIDNAFNQQGLTTPTSLAITSAAQSLTAGAVSGNVTVQVRNALGTVALAPSGGTLVQLTSTSGTGVFKNGASTITSILIPAGSSTASFQYTDTVVGTPILTTSASGLASASQSISINATSATTQLAFSSSPLNQAVGSTSGTMTITLEDASGNAINASGGGVVISLNSSSSNGVFKNLSGGIITTVTIASAASTASFEYSDTSPGLPIITAGASGLVSAIQQETVTATLTSISFTTPAHTMILGASPATFTIQLNDQAGNPIAAGSNGVNIALTTNSSAGIFYSAANAVVTSVTVPAGASSVTFAYRDTHLGTPIITASTVGFASISQQQTVQALPSGTVAFYAFNTSAGLFSDTSGSGNTLALGGGTVSYTGTNLPAGFTGAASFASNGYLQTSSGTFPVNVPTGNSPYTISTWIDITNANKNGIVGWGNWGTTNQVNAFRTTQGDAAPDGAGLDNYWWGNDYVQSTMNLVNQWVYVTATYNGAYRSIYVNGQLAGTYTSANADNAQAVNFRVGDTNNAEFFTGKMADLLIANTALTNAQINELYEAIGDPPTSLAITTPAHTMIRGASPASFTIQLTDPASNATTADGSVVVNLGSSSTGGTFYNSSNGIITSITIPAGSSSATVAYRDTQLGNPIITAGATGLTSATQQQTVSALPTGTVGYWAFNTSAGLLSDTSGSGNTLKVAGGTVAFTTTGLPAGFTGAAAFSNSGYLVTNSGSFPTNIPTGNSSYTIAAWIDINNTNKDGIVGWGNWGSTDQVNAFRTTSGDTGAGNGAGLDNYWWNDDYIQATASLLNTWVYAAVTYNGSLRTIYLNGVQAGTYTSANHAASIAVNFAIGTTDNHTEFFGGDMADLLIANTALSASQILSLYNGT